MAITEEEFSFPAPLPCCIESPPLWRSVTVLEEDEEEEEEEEEEKLKYYYYNDGEEEKMDILWEGLNEESPRRSCCVELMGGGEKPMNSSSSPGKQVRVCCVNGFKLSKATRHMFRGKRSSRIMVFTRVLKKRFAMHHARSSLNKRALL